MLESNLFALDWLGLDVTPFVESIHDTKTPEQQLRRFRLADSGAERVVAEVAGDSNEMRQFDMAQTVFMLTNIVPNAWWARAIVGDGVTGLQARGFDADRPGALSGLRVEQLRAWLDAVPNSKAEALFRAEVAAGRIRFRLRADEHNWRLPFEAETYEPEGADQLVGGDGQALRKSLFAPIYRGDFSNQDERDIAVYLDGNKALAWWHRNVARSHYAISGWRREKVYPDFIFAVQQEEASKRIVVLEMKGQQLAGNDDTEYKRSLLRQMTESFSVENVEWVGELELVNTLGVVVACDLVLMPEWRARLPGFLSSTHTE